MGKTTEVQRPSGSTAVVRDSRVRGLVLLSGACLAVQVSATDHGPGDAGAAALWFVVGCVLLWFVDHWRSRVARGVVVVLGLAGAVIFGIGVLGGVPHALLLMTAYLGQALLLLSGPVRRHVQTGVAQRQPA